MTTSNDTTAGESTTNLCSFCGAETAHDDERCSACKRLTDLGEMRRGLDPYGYCGPTCRNLPTGLDDASGREHDNCPSQPCNGCDAVDQDLEDFAACVIPPHPFTAGDSHMPCTDCGDPFETHDGSVEHHDDDCPDGCMADSCMSYDMNPDYETEVLDAALGILPDA